MLFENIIFGPIKSRRLGISLGVNLLPTRGKLCNFDCVYCECGFNADNRASQTLPTFAEISRALEDKLLKMSNLQEKLDVITFAGNGEPTLHPEFEKIVAETIRLRNKFFPNAKISVLSNATNLSSESVFRALNSVDNNILKLDSAVEKTLFAINQPTNKNFSVADLIAFLACFNGNLIIQTLLFNGEFNGKKIDNTAADEISAWLAALAEIRPQKVMIYTLDRATPAKNLQRPSLEKMHEIAQKVRDLGIPAEVTEY